MRTNLTEHDPIPLLGRPPPKITGSAAGVSIPDVVKIHRIAPDKLITWGLCVPPVGEDGLAVSA
jgi:hypothetical protein